MNETGNEFLETENFNQEREEAISAVSELSANLPQTVPYLLHIQTGEPIILAENQAIITLGKPNHTNSPDIDLSNLGNSEIISRQHAQIHMEAEKYYIEDLGSSNGTYVNNKAIPERQRHEIASEDIIALGKENKVTFIFKLP